MLIIQSYKANHLVKKVPCFYGHKSWLLQILNVFDDCIIYFGLKSFGADHSPAKFRYKGAGQRILTRLPTFPTLPLFFPHFAIPVATVLSEWRQEAGLDRGTGPSLVANLILLWEFFCWNYYTEGPKKIIHNSTYKIST